MSIRPFLKMIQFYSPLCLKCSLVQQYFLHFPLVRVSLSPPILNFVHYSLHQPVPTPSLCTKIFQYLCYHCYSIFYWQSHQKHSLFSLTSMFENVFSSDLSAIIPCTNFPIYHCIHTQLSSAPFFSVNFSSIPTS